MKPQHITLLGSSIKYWEYHADQPQTIVMIHGFRGDHFGLEYLISQLPQYRIIIPDLPGFGESSPMTDEAHSIEGYVQFVTTFLQQLKLPKPVLLGHSFGSIIVSAVAADHSELIAKLILINPIASPALKGPRTAFTQLARFYYWIGMKLPEKPGNALLGSKAITLATSALMAKTKDKTLRKTIHQNHLQHFSNFADRSTLSQAFKASVGSTVADNATKITVPTLLLAGEKDDIAPLSAQQKLEEALPDGILVTIPDVGHLIHYETPAEAAECIAHFLD